MKTCDLCAAEIDDASMKTVSPTEMRNAVIRGLSLPEKELTIARGLGLTEAQAIEQWQESIRTDETSWGLCPECEARLSGLQNEEPEVKPAETDVEQSKLSNAGVQEMLRGAAVRESLRVFGLNYEQTSHTQMSLTMTDSAMAESLLLDHNLDCHDLSQKLFRSGKLEGQDAKQLYDLVYAKLAPNEESTRDETDRSETENSGCFIATACYGSSHAPEVITLRRFRDVVLLRSQVGRGFVSLYYRMSPPIARKLGNYPQLATVVRIILLNPLAAFLGR